MTVLGGRQGGRGLEKGLLLKEVETTKRKRKMGDREDSASERGNRRQVPTLQSRVKR